MPDKSFHFLNLKTFFTLRSIGVKLIINITISSEFWNKIYAFLIAKTSVESCQIGMIQKWTDFDLSKEILFNFKRFNFLFIQYLQGTYETCFLLFGSKNLAVSPFSDFGQYNEVINSERFIRFKIIAKRSDGFLE